VFSGAARGIPMVADGRMPDLSRTDQQWAADERATPPVTSTKPGRATVAPPVDKSRCERVRSWRKHGGRSSRFRRDVLTDLVARLGVY
jgi:hypothetical protein